MVSPAGNGRTHDPSVEFSALVGLALPPAVPPAGRNGSAGATLAACAPSPSTPVVRRTAQSQKVQLVYQDWRTDWFPPMARQMLEQFHASQPNIQVFYTLDPPSESFEEKMLADFQAGTMADVFAGCCSFFPVWAQKGYSLDLRPFVQADLDRATLDDWDAVPVQVVLHP